MTPHKNDFTPALILLLAGWFFFILALGSHAFASDLSTEPMDGSSSAPVVQSDGSASEPESESESGDEYNSDPLLFDLAEVDEEPDTYDPSEDVVVNRSDLQSVIDLLNDLSNQLSLFCSESPSGYQPTEEDLSYREDLLFTLSDIRDSLVLLTSPAPEETVEDTSEDVSADASSEAETSSPPVSRMALQSSESPDSSAPSDSDPADDPSTSTDVDADESTDDDSISEQDFFRLVLALLLVIALLPFIGWLYRFISSFFPV